MKMSLSALMAQVWGAVLGWCVMSSAVAAQLNLDSARKEALTKPLLVRFTDQTRIVVNLLTAKADAGPRRRPGSD